MASRVWKDGRRGIAYVEGREIAEQVIAMAGRRAAPVLPRRAATSGRSDAALMGAMAVYSDRRGRPFAWQIPFDIGHWDRVTALVGEEAN